jgi:hypothetical protein
VRRVSAIIPVNRALRVSRRSPRRGSPRRGGLARATSRRITPKVAFSITPCSMYVGPQVDYRRVFK